ncbi:MAG: hypothetical protein O2973_02680 [Gemmatimonadetes bacterium]|nr:hypothetical protein [Gemmatimonadota bacterium]
MTHPSSGETSAALSRELSDFLIELSIGLHKNAIYPPGHPLLEGATSGIARRVDALLQGRASLSLGVARQQLIIEGVATDEGNPGTAGLGAAPAPAPPRCREVHCRRYTR